MLRNRLFRYGNEQQKRRLSGGPDTVMLVWSTEMLFAEPVWHKMLQDRCGS